jgi:hypothetical protein
MYNIINRLFNQRSLGTIEDGLCKAIIVEMVGKSLMVNKDTGEPSKTYCPPLTAWIYAMCRLQCFKFILKNNLQDSVVAICTDEVITTKKAVTKIEAEKKIMGTWRMKEQTPMVILSPGWIISKDKNPHSVNYESVTQTIISDPNNSHYKFPVKQRVTLHKALEELHDVSKIGQFYEASNSIDLNEIRASQDRQFKRFPSTGKQLLSGKIYDSEPIKV